MIVDITTARADQEIYGIDATYSLTEIATKKVVLTGRASRAPPTTPPASSNAPPGARGERDARNPRSTIIAEQIEVAACVLSSPVVIRHYGALRLSANLVRA